MAVYYNGKDSPLACGKDYPVPDWRILHSVFNDHLVGPWARANENPKKANKQFGISRLIQHDAGFVANGDFSAAFESRSSTGNCAFRRQDNVSVDVYESATTQRRARF